VCFVVDVTRANVKVGFVYDRFFLQHVTGELHRERPERLTVINEGLERAGLLDRLEPLAFRQASADQLALVHDPAYVDLVRMMCDEGFTFVGSRETCICPRSYDVAALAAGGVIGACEAVVKGQVARAFCAVRPPGHHAETDQAMGFCLFNNVALGAEYLVRQHEMSRIAIVDLDVHHGNGTQHFFASRNDVLYISLHERPGSLEFPGTGEVTETGIGEGEGYTVNIPLTRGCRVQEYAVAMEERVLPALKAFRPEFLLLSTGFDALMWDNAANMSLREEDFGPITEYLVGCADRHCGGRMVSVLEGGYDLPRLGQAAAAHVRALLGI
jgi:acetoin utilization deacetylase AcuC-like enzyme